MRLIVHYGSDDDSGSDIYLNEHVKEDFSDLRFTASDGETLLSYWFESKTSGDRATVWVKVASTPKKDETGTIYVYYGNDDASDVSSGSSTFILFEPGDSLTNWTKRTAGSGNVTVSSGKLKFAGPSGNSNKEQIRSNDPVCGATGGVAVKFKLDITGTEDYVFSMWITSEIPTADVYGSSKDYHRYGNITSYSSYNINHSLNDGGTSLFSVDTEHIENGSYVFEMLSISGAQRVYRDGTSKDSRTATYDMGDDMYLVFAAVSAWDQPHEFLLYDVSVRKWVDGEPTSTSTGDEETPSEPSISAAFSGTPTEGHIPLTVSFTDASIANNTTITGWYWEFGDGGTSTEQDPEHVYEEEGHYTVSLEVTDGTISDEEVKTSYIYARGDDVEIANVTRGEALANLWTIPGWAGEHAAVVTDLFDLFASDGPERTYGGVGKNVDNTQVVDPATENYWETIIQAVLPGALVDEADIRGGDVLGNWWNLQLFQIEANAVEAKKLMGRINWISLDQMQLGVSIAGIFWAKSDALPVPQDRRFLTAYKLGHSDLVQLIDEDYALEIIEGVPPSEPRFVTQCCLGAGIQLVEWDIPDDPGSGDIAEYRIYRGTDPDAMAQIDSVDGGTLHYLDPAAPDRAIYCITCFNGVAESVAGWASPIEEPDLACRSLRDCICGDAVCGLSYAGWVRVRTITLIPSTTTIVRKGQELMIASTIRPADATMPELSWSSSRNEIASVSSGTIAALSPGRARITARSTDGSCASASVSVIVVPAFMVDDLQIYLEAQELGVPVFTRKQPDAIDRCITLVQLSGEPADPSGKLAYPTLQVLIRSPDLGDAEALRKDIHDLLHGLGPVTINGTRYSLFEAWSTGSYTEKERKVPRYVSTLSLRVGRELTISEPSEHERGHDIVGRLP
jgi:PKD repeat protein